MVCCAAGSASSDGSGRSPWSPLAGACCCLACLRGHMHGPKVSNRVHAACSERQESLTICQVDLQQVRHRPRSPCMAFGCHTSPYQIQPSPRAECPPCSPLWPSRKIRGCERSVFPTKRCHRFSCNGTGLFSLRVHSVDPNLPPSYRMTHANDRHVPFLRGVQQ